MRTRDTMSLLAVLAVMIFLACSVTAEAADHDRKRSQNRQHREMRGDHDDGDRRQHDGEGRRHRGHDDDRDRGQYDDRGRQKPDNDFSPPARRRPQTVVVKTTPTVVKRVETVVYAHGHARHVCNTGCSHYRVVRSYPHGHAHHHCHSGCSHYEKRSGFSFSIRIGGNDCDSGARIYYSTARRYTPCGRCGAGYYKRAWVPRSCVTRYDSCGRPYIGYTGGYYTTTWVEHTCH